MLKRNIVNILRCDEITMKMLELIQGHITILIVRDDIECEKHLKQRVLKKLKSFEEDNSRTCRIRWKS